MSMHLAPVYFNSYGKSKRKPNKKILEAQAKHEKWLMDRGLHIDQIHEHRKSAFRVKAPNLKTKNVGILSNKIDENGIKRGIMVNLHKESSEVQQQIIDKANRTTVAYNKGPVMYFSPDADTSKLGSQSRR